MTERDFALLYPCELVALAHRYSLKQKRIEMQEKSAWHRAALIASTVANFSMVLDRRKFPQGLSPAMFLGKTRSRKPRVQTADEQFAIFDRLTKRG